MKHRTNPILSKNDRELLLFLWRHRIATFQTLKTIFFPGKSNTSSYYRLRTLRYGEFIRFEKLVGTANRACSLDKRGFSYLEANCLPELKSKAYKPHRQYHDLLATAALLGESWIATAPTVQVVTEQELASTQVMALPQSLRKSMVHAPDGIWLIDSGIEKFGVALEVEISAKSSERYEQTCSFYGSQLFFQHVVWIIESKALGSRILEASRRYGIPREGVHLFVLKEDFEKHLWQSQFVNHSMADITLDSFLRRLALPGSSQTPKNSPHAVPTRPPSGPYHEVISPLLDFELRLGNSTTYPPRPKVKNS